MTEVKTLIVTNISSAVDQSHLHELFSACGSITKLNMEKLPNGEQVCRITYSDANSAKAAVVLDGTPLGDKKLRVALDVPAPTPVPAPAVPAVSPVAAAAAPALTLASVAAPAAATPAIPPSVSAILSAVTAPTAPVATAAAPLPVLPGVSTAAALMPSLPAPMLEQAQKRAEEVRCAKRCLPLPLRCFSRRSRGPSTSVTCRPWLTRTRCASFS